MTYDMFRIEEGAFEDLVSHEKYFKAPVSPISFTYLCECVKGGEEEWDRKGEGIRGSRWGSMNGPTVLGLELVLEVANFCH